LSSIHSVLPRRAAVHASFAAGLVITFALGAGAASAQTSPSSASASAPAPAPPASKYLAPGFTQLPRAAKVLVMPVDVELFSLSAGGVAEPRADWTATALGHMSRAMSGRVTRSGLDAVMMDEAGADEFAEQIGLHAAVARSIALHHGVGGVWTLPSKEGRLDWSFDDAMRPLQAKTGARYAVFIWMRDSYASAERKAAMVAMAILGVGLTGGSQVGYASLVDLETGRVLWFNRLARASGDLREEKAASESLDALLAGFPGSR
jgi:hypothetical protein